MVYPKNSILKSYNLEVVGCLLDSKQLMKRYLPASNTSMYLNSLVVVLLADRSVPTSKDPGSNRAISN